MHTLFHDLRFTLRQLRKNLGFTLTAVLTLALGIGATTSIFSLVNAVLLRPLPYRQPGQLVQLRHEAHVGGAKDDNSLSYPDFFDWRAKARSFGSMSSFRDERFTLTGLGEAVNLQAEVVSSDFFRVFGVHPMLGRDFVLADEKPGQHVVVLSHEFWQSKFGARPDIVGQTITLDRFNYTVIGVMPAGFAFPMEDPVPQFWTPLSADAFDPDGGTPLTTQRGADMLTVVARMKPGVTLPQAQAEMNIIEHNLSVQYPDTNKRYEEISAQPLLKALVGDARPALRVLFLAVGFLLLIACANVAGLLLARASRRQAEIALRAALGATRGEIMRQVLVESIVLSLLGGTLGLALSTVILKIMLQFGPKNIPRLDAISMDASVLGFALAASVITGILFGVLPAWRMSSLDPSAALRDGARSVTGARSHHRLHSMLVIAETALGLLLLTGSGLFIRSFVHVLQVNPGFDKRNVITASLDYPDQKDFVHKADAFYDQLLPRVAVLPGVTSVGAGFPVPFSGSQIGLGFDVEGHPTAKGDEPVSRMGVITPGYFETLRIPLLRGRSIAATDSSSAPMVVVVSESFAKKYFPGEDPIGKHITPGIDDGVHHEGPRQIIGIVGDVKTRSLTAESPTMFYLPYSQATFLSPYLVIRTAGDPTKVIGPLRAQLSDLDRNVPLSRVHTLDDLLSNAASQPRFSMVLLTFFAAMALLLAAVGLYAVLSYMVAQRTSEMGLRLALGAQRSDVLRLILKRGLVLAGIGIGVGLVASTVLTRFASSLLFGVHAFDPATYVAVTVVFLLISLIASAAPAVRAASVDPGKTLRDS